ncbi:MAG: hypothetical protein LBU34_15675 [Planctomycetaceae bacterium]|jgi:hypothetical protein|nr:hypothetical protein [Planctomycetaceae bacterium]
MSEEKELDEIVNETIMKNLAMPKEIQSEAGMVKHHTLPELIQAKKYLDQQKAAKKGLQFVQIDLQ